MFVQALFLYIEKRIIRIIGNPVMDDNCKMVAGPVKIYAQNCLQAPAE